MTELDKIKWQCRRGSRELDLLLNSYLQNRYLVADDQEKSRFIELLKLDDPEVLDQFNMFYAQGISQDKQ